MRINEVTLRYDLIGAFKAGERDSPLAILKRAGFNWKRSESVSIADCWMFYQCHGDMNNLPDHFEQVTTEVTK